MTNWDSLVQVRSLGERARQLVRETGDAQLVAMVGPRLSGLSPERVNYLRRKGLLTKEEADGGYRFPLPGTDVSVSPWELAVIIGVIYSREGRAQRDVEKAWRDVLNLRGKRLSGWLRKAASWVKNRLRLSDPAEAAALAFFTEEEQAIADGAASQAAAYLASEIDNTETAVETAIADAVASGMSAEELAEQLATITQVWDRDWRRVARTELQGAYNEAVVQNAIFTDGPNARIARVPEPDACEACMSLFVRDGKPIIWDVNDLLANGNNIGRKRPEWLATLWPIHPNCKCIVESVPPGYEFDDAWNLVLPS